MVSSTNGAAGVAAFEADGPPLRGVPAEPGDGTAIPPLAISGLVVAKADLVAALRIYVPTIVDVAALDGDRFFLNLRHGS